MKQSNEFSASKYILPTVLQPFAHGIFCNATFPRFCKLILELNTKNFDAWTPPSFHSPHPPRSPSDTRFEAPSLFEGEGSWHQGPCSWREMQNHVPGGSTLTATLFSSPCAYPWRGNWCWIHVTIAHMCGEIHPQHSLWTTQNLYMTCDNNLHVLLSWTRVLQGTPGMTIGSVFDRILQ